MGVSQRDRFLEHSLTRYRRATLNEILSLVPDKEPRRYLYTLIRDYVQRGSKGIRPAICIATCVAFGGAFENALSSAAALELFHNAALMHDDVEDGSTLRRGHATLNYELGNALAVNAGDALYILAVRSLFSNVGKLNLELAGAVLQEFSLMAMETVEGQAMELGWIRDNVMGLVQEDYLRLVLKKTCCYTCIYPLRIGALLSRNKSVKVESFNELGLCMGVAFQIRDDWLGLLGSRERFGKDIYGDIWEGKRSLMLMHALTHCTSNDRRWIEAFFGLPRNQRTEKDVLRIFDVMQHCGSIGYAADVSKHFVAKAEHEYLKVFGDLPESGEVRFIKELIAYLGERDY
jgi:geranylgeranyl diphosphate synthase type II